MREPIAGFSFLSFLASAWFLPLPLAVVPSFSGVPGATATGSGETSGVLASLPGRGHEKSSARPAGAAKVSPRLKTFAAIGSDVVFVE
jgi:hypothetical protein